MAESVDMKQVEDALARLAVRGTIRFLHRAAAATRRSAIAGMKITKRKKTPRRFNHTRDEWKERIGNLKRGKLTPPFNNAQSGDPGSFPNVRTIYTKRSIVYAVDEENGTAMVGPASDVNGKNPSALGKVQRDGTRNKRVIVKPWFLGRRYYVNNTITWKARPLMLLAFVKGIKKAAFQQSMDKMSPSERKALAFKKSLERLGRVWGGRLRRFSGKASKAG